MVCDTQNPFQDIKDLITADMKQLEKANGLKGFEMVGWIAVSPRQWTIFILLVHSRRMFIFILTHLQWRAIFSHQR